jgi:hypothetical protein
VTGVAGRTLIRPFATSDAAADTTQSISIIYLLNKCSICFNPSALNSYSSLHPFKSTGYTGMHPPKYTGYAGLHHPSLRARQTCTHLNLRAVQACNSPKYAGRLVQTSEKSRNALNENALSGKCANEPSRQISHRTHLLMGAI